MKEIENYLESLRIGNKSYHTIRTYKKDLTKFENYFKPETIDDLNKLTKQDFIQFYGEQNLNDKSLNGLIRSLLAFFKNLLNDGLISEKHPFFQVKFGKNRFVDEKRVKKVVLTPEEEKELILAGKNLQDRFMLSLMLFTGLRRDEICRIKLSDLNEDENGNTFIKIRGKGDKEDIVVIDGVLTTLMNAYFSERNTDSPYLFYATRGESNEKGMISGSTVNNRVKSAALRANIPQEKAEKLTAHRLRATVITRFSKTHGRHVAQKIARHASETTTALYDESQNEHTLQMMLNQRNG